MSRSDHTILITGGAGFIGSSLVRFCLRDTTFSVINLDKLTYAGHRESLSEVLEDPRHTLIVGDISDRELVAQTLRDHRPQAIIHLAAESHVDRSIADPPSFATTNVLGTCVLLEAVTDYWQKLPTDDREAFRFLNVSTDEVFGTAQPGEQFTELSLLTPNSPYAASKAAGELLARSFGKTYGLPVVTANPSNNYGPRQHPEKLIPRMILAAVRGEPLPVFGDGLYERDWLHVEDCCRALLAILDQAQPEERYLVGANQCLQNLEVVATICDLVDEFLDDRLSRRELIGHVADRPGHDRRYAVDASALRSKTSWQPQVAFDLGLRETVGWYLNHSDWVSAVLSKEISR